MTVAISQGFIDSACRWIIPKQGFVPTVADTRGAIVLRYIVQSSRSSYLALCHKSAELNM